MGEKILITGGAGFIGSHLTDYLLKDDNEVVVLDNLSTGYIENLSDAKEKICYMQGDVRDGKLLSKALDGVTKVYHMAAEVGVEHVMKISKSAIWDVDLIGTRKVLDACTNSDVNTLLFASTSEVYGHYSQDKLPMAEDDDFEPDTIYGKAKKKAELLCKQFSDEFGLNAIAVRYFNVYGPRQSLNGYAVPHFIDAALRDYNIRINGNGKQTRDFTFIDDVIDATVKVCDKKHNKEVFNIGTGKPIVIMDLAKKIIDLCGSDSEIKFVLKRRPTDGYDKYADITKIKKHVGWEQKVGLEEGLKKTIQYHKNRIG